MTDRGAFIRSERWKARSFAEHQLRKRNLDDANVEALARAVNNRQALARMPFEDQVVAVAAAVILADDELAQVETVVDATYWSLRLAEYSEDLRLLCRFQRPSGDWMMQSGKPAPKLDRLVGKAAAQEEKLRAANPPVSDDAVREAYLEARERFPGRQKSKAIEASGFGKTRIRNAFGGEIP
jgi:hypothetical protein